MANELMHITFYNSLWFFGGWNHLIELFQVEYLINVLISWNLAVIKLSKFPSYLYQRKRKWMWLSQRVFCFYKFWLSFILRKDLWTEGRGVCRTQSNIYKGALKPLTTFTNMVIDPLAMNVLCSHKRVKIIKRLYP